MKTGTHTQVPPRLSSFLAANIGRKNKKKRKPFDFRFIFSTLKTDQRLLLLFPENFLQFLLKLIFEVINTGRLNKAHVFFCKTMGNLGQIFVQIEQ